MIEQSLEAQFVEVPRDELWENILPFGAIIGTLKVGDILATEAISDVVSDREQTFGDFRSGRVAIATTHPAKLETPLAWRGQ